MICKRTIAGFLEKRACVALCGNKDNRIAYSWRNVTCQDCIKIGHPIYREKKKSGNPKGSRYSKTLAKEATINKPGEFNIDKFMAFYKKEYE